MRINIRHNLLQAFLGLSVLLTVSLAEAEIIKRSGSGICHSPDSPYYEKTKNYTAFDDLESCLQQGGRLPRGQKKKSASAGDTVSGKRYKRSHFGAGWGDVDHDCQNTRMEILADQSTAPVRYKTDRKCMVVHGKWISPFTGKVHYSAGDLDIDHVVALAYSWHHGASEWSGTKREKFANDPVNLLAVEASLNRSKGASGPEEWLPPQNKCQYILRFRRIVKTYALSLTAAENEEHLRLQKEFCG